MEEIQKTGARLIEAAQLYYVVHKTLENYLQNNAGLADDEVASQMSKDLELAQEDLIYTTQRFYKATDIEPFGQYVVTRIIKGE